MPTITVDTQLRTYTCGQCGGFYAIGESYAAKKQEKGGYWHCPYCECSWGYPPEGTELAQAKRRAAELEGRLAAERAAHDQARQECQTLGRKLTTAQQDKARLRRRVANGVCPCCHRTFHQLARHMRTKHPEYVAH
jgi:hypothetical protein